MRSHLRYRGSSDLRGKRQHGNDRPYFSVYDNNAGNPGVEGRIMYLKNGILIVEIDDDLFEEMPANWSTEEGGKYAILDYAKTDEGIRLGYRGSDASFVKE